MAGQLYAKEIRCVTYGSSQQSQQRLGIETKLSRKDVSTSVDHLDIHGRLIKVLRILYQQKNCKSELKGTEVGWNERRTTPRAKPKMRRSEKAQLTEASQLDVSG